MEIALLSAVVGSIVGGLISAVGFFSRRKIREREAYRTLVYNLLYLWRDLAQLHYGNINLMTDKMVDTMIEELERRSEEKIDDTQRKQVVARATEIVQPVSVSGSVPQ